jgi:hypothetical protein
MHTIYQTMQLRDSPSPGEIHPSLGGNKPRPHLFDDNIYFIDMLKIAFAEHGN